MKRRRSSEPKDKGRKRSTSNKNNMFPELNIQKKKRRKIKRKRSKSGLEKWVDKNIINLFSNGKLLYLNSLVNTIRNMDLTFCEDEFSYTFPLVELLLDTDEVNIVDSFFLKKIIIEDSLKYKLLMRALNFGDGHLLNDVVVNEYLVKDPSTRRDDSRLDQFTPEATGLLEKSIEVRNSKSQHVKKRICAIRTIYTYFNYFVSMTRDTDFNSWKLPLGFIDTIKSNNLVDSNVLTHQLLKKVNKIRLNYNDSFECYRISYAIKIMLPVLMKMTNHNSIKKFIFQGLLDSNLERCLPRELLFIYKSTPEKKFKKKMSITKNSLVLSKENEDETKVYKIKMGQEIILFNRWSYIQYSDTTRNISRSEVFKMFAEYVRSIPMKNATITTDIENTRTYFRKQVLKKTKFLIPTTGDKARYITFGTNSEYTNDDEWYEFE